MGQRPSTPQNRQNALPGPQMKTSAPRTPIGKGCFHCGEAGHYANNCPKNVAQNTPGQTNSNGQRQNQQQQGHNGNQNQQANRGQQNYARGSVNHVTAESAQEAQDVVVGMFLVKLCPRFSFI